MTTRKPATVGEILVGEFMQPMGRTQATLAGAIGVRRKHVNELCNNRPDVNDGNRTFFSKSVYYNPFWLIWRPRSPKILAFFDIVKLSPGGDWCRRPVIC
ncbi:MAG TPA: addiction module antidote protein, HigA family [Rhizomicrobium sp.]|jgi:hypothetical protein|nr:addiction module antidote protein, HigA family [Rhizomicrobium sp.]